MKFDGENREEIAKSLNDLARHQIITKLYADILQDINVCGIEGWNKMEYIHMLQDMLNDFEKDSTNEKIKVVRCKACKYYQMNQCLFWCDLNSYMEPLPTDENDYCSKGKVNDE